MALCTRIECSFVMEALPAPASEVFPLLCPVREADWIPGWSADLRWSRSGLAEAGALFTTPGPGGRPWIWHIVDHDASAGRIRFSVVAPDSHLLELTLQLDPQGEGTRLEWNYRLMALGLEGEAFLVQYEAAFPRKMALLDRRLRHWLRTGTMLAEVPA